MSYAWRLAPDARADFHDLEVWLKEEVLDKIEELATVPEKLKVSEEGYVVVDFACTLQRARHIIFMRLHRDDRQRLLSITGLGDVSR